MKERNRRQRQVKYKVKLSQEELLHLKDITLKGKSSAKKIIHAQILLKSDESAGYKNHSDPEIAKMLGITERHVIQIRKRFVEEGLDSALNRKALSKTKPKKFGGEEEAHLIALACSQAPEGRARWTLKLLADRVVELEIMDKVSAATVGRTLKKTNLSRG